jgi:predicted heme/steroid binding protein
MREFKEEDLASFDGKDGRPAYAVVDGKVYDVSSSGGFTWGHMSRGRI